MSPINELARQGKQHLLHEEQLLGSIDGLADLIRTALTSREVSQEELEETYSKLSGQIHTARSARQRFRHAISLALQLPFEESTMGAIVARCDESIALELNHVRTRVRISANRINRELIANNHLAAQLLGTVNGVFHALFGIRAESAMYGSDGRRQAA